MSENQKKILEMLASNKISADEAYRLLNAIDNEEENKKEKNMTQDTIVKNLPKYLRVTVLPKEGSGSADRVNVRVPMSLIRAGIKLTSLIPGNAMDKMNGALQEKGIDFDVRNIKSEDIEELIEALGDMEVDVESNGEKVKVFVE